MFKILNRIGNKIKRFLIANKILLVSTIFVFSILLFVFVQIGGYSGFSKRNTTQRKILNVFEQNENVIAKFDFEKDFSMDYLSDQSLKIVKKEQIQGQRSVQSASSVVVEDNNESNKLSVQKIDDFTNFIDNINLDLNSKSEIDANK